MVVGMITSQAMPCNLNYAKQDLSIEDLPIQQFPIKHLSIAWVPVLNMQDVFLRSPSYTMFSCKKFINASSVNVVNRKIPIQGLSAQAY